MDTIPALRMPRTPRIPRARCEGCHSKYLDVTWLNFMSDFLWKFNVSIPHFAFDMYSDLRYGRALFRFARYWIDGGWSYDPDYGYNLSIAPTDEPRLPPGELTIPSDALKINIDGTTYEKLWAGSDVVVYHTGALAPRIHKIGYSFVDVPTAWDEHDIASVEGGEGVSEGRAVNWGCGFSALGYGAGGTEICFVFDTSETPEGAVSRTLQFTVASMNDVGYGTPVLELVQLSDALSTSDYDTGALIDTLSIPSADIYTVALSNDDINYGGITRIKLSLTSLEGAQIDSAYVNLVLLAASVNVHAKITFTY